MPDMVSVVVSRAKSTLSMRSDCWPVSSTRSKVLVSRGGLGFGTTALKRNFTTTHAGTRFFPRDSVLSSPIQPVCAHCGSDWPEPEGANFLILGLSFPWAARPNAPRRAASDIRLKRSPTVHGMERTLARGVELDAHLIAGREPPRWREWRQRCLTIRKRMNGSY
jgi:hypothetical protein